MSLALFLGGLELNGSAPAPGGDMGAQVAPHRYDAQMTFTETTDTLAANKWPSEFWAMKYNIQPTAFLSPYHATDHDLINFGRVKPSVYYDTDRWKRFTDSALAGIADYYETAWTANGPLYFPVVQGEAKPARYPNLGQEVYDLSNGQVGYDVAKGTMGAYGLEEMRGIVEKARQFHQANYNFTPYCFSYRNGMNNTPQAYKPFWIGGRNSDSSISGSSYTSYGQGYGYPGEAMDRVAQVNRASSMRFRDFYVNLGGGTYEDAQAYLAQELNATLANRGWFENFQHWHTSGGVVDLFFGHVKTILAGEDVYYADYETAMRYLWARESLQSVSVQGNTVSLVWSAFDIPEALDVPVSIRIDTTGTSLQGKEITSSVGAVLKKSVNAFVVEVPYNTASFTISETTTPSYIDLSAPVIGFDLSGATLTVTTDKPCKVAIWKAAAGTAESALGAPVRSNVFQTTHTFAVTSAEAAGDLYIGALSERGQSAVVKVGEAPASNLLFSDNLEGSSYLEGWNIQNGGTAYALQHVAGPTGGKALRFELRAGDPPNNSGTRTEVYYPNRLEEAWYSFKCYFPSAEYADETGNSRESICQFHQGGGSGSPYNMLLVEKGIFRLFLDNDAGRNIRLDLGPQGKDQWHQFVFYTRFSQYEEGHIKCWLNGSLVADETGPNLAAGFSLPEVKLGLYKWDWNNSGTTTTDKRVLWLDEVKIGGADATYAQMSAIT